eukprot:CAMPEP_0113463530 /NCGR_PEP_ID=MMETSP0014_2-20120614/12701_1 /TAXON_ID=2857 /ORGANISM="Nitzschia sp." /LENGTH=354 /DNA_ID=CAMNT_0000355519 /DNA_START=33 /DNA_END=1097 /DNA_ORIENTATION=- /assembly_acc=CAM_ASM_000159
MKSSTHAQQFRMKSTTPPSIVGLLLGLLACGSSTMISAFSPVLFSSSSSRISVGDLRPATTSTTGRPVADLQQQAGGSSNSMTGMKFHTTALLADASSSDDNGGAPTQQQKKRRRKRKDATATATSTTNVASSFSPPDETSTAAAPSTAAPVIPIIELKTRDETPVQLQVKNVRDVVTGSSTAGSGGGDSFPAPVASTPPQAAGNSASTTPTSISSPAAASSSPSPEMSSFEQLLEDAKKMKEQELEDDDDDNSSPAFINALGDSEGTGIKSAIGNALSTLVTADFFLVCAFLVWFLVGIFCSSVLKNDFVQIQFNNNFERLVQPALGVLMIASIGSNFFAENEEGDDNNSNMM